jgi:hypothetical protein
MLRRFYPGDDRTFGALWALPASPSTPGPTGAVDLRNMRARAIMLDPEYTSPGAAVGVNLGDGHPRILRPGDVLAVPAGMAVLPTKFSVWNAERAHAERALGALTQLVGCVAFLAAENVNELLIFQKTPPRESVRVIGYSAAILPPVGGNPAIFDFASLVAAASGLRGLRLDVVALDAGGNAMVAPADLAATLRLWRSSMAFGFDKAKTPDNPTLQPAQLWVPISGNLLVSQTDMSFDLPVEVGGLLVGVSAENLAGAGVAALGGMLEGR